jgi:hypothetical protein
MGGHEQNIEASEMKMRGGRFLNLHYRHLINPLSRV